MTTHSSLLAWEIPWTEEPGGLQPHQVAQSWTPPKHLSMHACNQRHELHFHILECIVEDTTKMCTSVKS